MLRRMSVVAVLIGLALSLGLGPLAPSKAHAAAYCNLYAPSRIAIWGSNTEFTVRYGAGCRVSGTDEAYWVATHPTAGEGFGLYWSREANEVEDTTDYLDYYPLGRQQWVAQGAWDVNGEPAGQNQPFMTVKLGSVSYVSVKRSGGYHEVTARAYHYSPNSSAIVASGSRPGQVQFRVPGDNTWRPVAGVKLGGNGQTTIRTWSPGPRYYRVSLGEQPTLWDTISTQVRAR